MAKIPITSALKSRIFAALLTAGVAGPSAYYAANETVVFEGFMTHLHLDPVGKATTGVGHLVTKGEKPKQNYTEQEVIDQYVKDWIIHEKLLDTQVKVPYRSGWQKAAFADFTFNKGIGNVKSSTLLKELNNGNHDRSCVELTKWVFGTVNGKKVKLKGLDIRAQKQYKYCMGYEPADYKTQLQQYKESAK